MMTPQEKSQALYQMNFDGNIIPHNWYKNITFDNGKPQLNAIIILAEIVYWYRPKLLKDENTGRVAGLVKRFKADLLQRSYDSFAEQFGLSKKQVKDAILKLEELGIIARVFRDISTKQGVMSNVLFIDIYPEILQVHTYGHRSTHPPTSKDTPPNIKGETYTETTTKTTTEKESPRQKISKNVDYLDHIASIGDVTEDTATNPIDQWFEYSDKFIKSFNERLQRYPKQAEKDIIADLAGREDADPALWLEALDTAVIHHPHGNPNLQRCVELYEELLSGGDWESYREKKWPSETKNVEYAEVSKDGGFYA